MALLLYINGQLADLDAGAVIAQTRQVNDLNSLDNRQASYTNKFSLPKTATNVRIMQFLTLTGNNSPVPYQKNECSLYSASGECFVYKGWAVVTDGGDSYEAVIYDGIIDLYKAIENKTLADLSLTELVHDKTVTNVINSWNANVPYRYILADYNGNTGNTNAANPSVNVDYLIPSVNVAWLWKKVFDAYNNGVYPLGSVFNMADFKQLYMTFPKGQVRNTANDSAIFNSNNYNFRRNGNNSYANIYYARFVTYNTFLLSQANSNIHLKVSQSASYKLVIKGKLNGHRRDHVNTPRDSRIRIGKNCESATGYEAAFGTKQLLVNGQRIFGAEAESIPAGEEFEITSNPFQLNGGDSICVAVTRAAGGDDTYDLAENNSINELEVTLYRVDPDNVDFSTVLTDFSIRDFLSEVVHRFGLTLFKDKFSDSYTFLTLQEQLQTPHIENWSGKFSQKVSENYIYGNYAQTNWLRYAYNDKESTHSDSAIQIENVNLTDTRDIIKSKIYSPERIPSRYLGQNSNVYKLWDKETVEDPEPDAPTVTYKALDKRYYFMKALPVTGSTITLKSPELGTTTTAASYYRETYRGLTFSEIISNYYLPLQTILNKAMIVTAQLWLNDQDIVTFDFKKLYYIEQLSNYFMVNKINNYVPGKVTTCELVRVRYTEPPVPQKELFFEYSNRNTARITGAYTANYTVGSLVVQWSTDLLNWYQSGWAEDGTTFFYLPYVANMYYYRVYDVTNNVASNTIPTLIP